MNNMDHEKNKYLSILVSGLTLVSIFLISGLLIAEWGIAETTKGGMLLSVFAWLWCIVSIILFTPVCLICLLIPIIRNKIGKFELALLLVVTAVLIILVGFSKSFASVMHV